MGCWESASLGNRGSGKSFPLIWEVRLFVQALTVPVVASIMGPAWKAPGSAGGAVPVPWDLRSVPSSVGQKPLEASGWIPDREV